MHYIDIKKRWEKVRIFILIYAVFPSVIIIALSKSKSIFLAEILFFVLTFTLVSGLLAFFYKKYDFNKRMITAAKNEGIENVYYDDLRENFVARFIKWVVLILFLVLVLKVIEGMIKGEIIIG